MDFEIKWKKSILEKMTLIFSNYHKIVGTQNQGFKHQNGKHSGM